MQSLAERDNKFSLFNQGRGSSVVEQPIRNRQVAGSTPALGSSYLLFVHGLDIHVHR